MRFPLFPFDFLWSVYDAWGRYSSYYIQAVNHEERFDLMKRLEGSISKVLFRETMPEEQLNMMARQITVPFQLILVLVMFTSVFIIFTSFQVITMERLPVIGMFRSIGATRWMTASVFLAEAGYQGVSVCWHFL